VAELVEARVAVLEAEPAGVREVLRHLRPEDLERSLDARGRGDRGLRAAAQVGVVEVHEPVRGGAHLAALPQLRPRLHRLVRAHRGQHP
jgi:hypothetical protein